MSANKLSRRNYTQISDEDVDKLVYEILSLDTMLGTNLIEFSFIICYSNHVSVNLRFGSIDRLSVGKRRTCSSCKNS